MCIENIFYVKTTKENINNSTFCLQLAPKVMFNHKATLLQSGVLARAFNFSTYGGKIGSSP